MRVRAKRARAPWLIALASGSLAFNGALAAQADPVPGPPDPAAPAGSGRSPVLAQAGVQLLPGVREAPEEPLADDAEGPKWGLAPIRWGGNASLDVQSLSGDGLARRTRLVEQLNLRAATYIWQPWFAQVAGSLALLSSQDRGARAEDDAGSAIGTGRGSSVTGTLATSVFPQSRFPFYGAYTRSDSRAGDALTVTDVHSQRLTLRQSWRNFTGDTQATFGFDRSQLRSDTFGADRVDALLGNVIATRGDHRYELLGSHTRNTRTSDEQRSTISRVALTHVYRPDEYLTVTSLASSLSSSLRVRAAGGTLGSQLGFRQLTSFASWSPDTEKPLLITGSMRLSDATQGGLEGEDGRNRSLALTGSAIYRPTPNLSLSGSLAGSAATAGETSTRLFTETGSAIYFTDPIPLGAFTYSASSTASVAHASGAQDGSRLVSGVSGSHSLLRNFIVTPSTSWGVSGSQTLAWLSDSRNGAANTIAHSAGLNLRHDSESGLNAYAGLTIGDTRTTGFLDSHFQLANLQLSGQMQLSRYAFASANFTAQATRQESALQPGQGLQHFTSGGASYQHVKAFDVPRLRYVALLNFYNQQVTSRALGDPNAMRENVTWSAEQRLEYVIGRLDVRVTLRFAEVDGKKNALLFFRVNRQFGGY